MRLDHLLSREEVGVGLLSSCQSASAQTKEQVMKQASQLAGKGLRFCLHKSLTERELKRSISESEGEEHERGGK